MGAARPLGKSPCKVSRQADRPSRRVTLTVTARPVTVQGARRPGGRWPAVKVWAVSAKEAQPPQGEAPLDWLLLTSVPGENFAGACTVVQGYRARGEIALFFRVLQHGCQIERLRLATDPRLLTALAIYLIIAWRMHAVTRMGRTSPEASGEVVFEPREWQAIYTMPYHSPPPAQPPPLRDTLRALAQLGGFLARTGDGEPGIKSMWHGYQRLHDFIYAVATHLAVNAL